MTTPTKYTITLDLDRVEYTTHVEEDDIPVRGNVIDGGPGYEEADRAVEDEILERLGRGDVWAWACVTVTASLGCFEGRSVPLGACTYRDEAEFEECGELDDLKEEALDDLRQQIKLAGGDPVQQLNLEHACTVIQQEIESVGNAMLSTWVDDDEAIVYAQITDSCECEITDCFVEDKRVLRSVSAPTLAGALVALARALLDPSIPNDVP